MTQLHRSSNVGLRSLGRRAIVALTYISVVSGFLSGVSLSTIRLPSTYPAPSIVQQMSSSTAEPPSWQELVDTAAATPTGQAMNEQVALRAEGYGSPSRENTLRLFDSPKKNKPVVTLYRDHAAWCPYCQKTMLLIEEKRIPVTIELINMRSYGDKPRSFLRKVPNGLLPAMEVQGQVITESQTIMELLEEWFPPNDGYKAMVPSRNADKARFRQLAQLERELFRWWCTVVFRPELGGGVFGGGGGAMQGFMDCLRQVDKQLQSTDGPWFFDEYDHPTMIDMIYVSHVERMLASVAYWKGVNLRDTQTHQLHGLVRWLEAFEQREAYLAFKSDYYTHIKDIPPQYGPGYDGGLDTERRALQATILGQDGTSWHLPLSHDDPLQPLYKGPPLPLAILQAMDLTPDANGTYESCDPATMAQACRTMAAWKLAGNGPTIAQFAARGGPSGAQNPRKSFSAPLADPYAASDTHVQPHVDAVLRVVCAALLDVDATEWDKDTVRRVVPAAHQVGVRSSLLYLRDRVGVPRDLPLASARYLRAYLNWAIDALLKTNV